MQVSNFLLKQFLDDVMMGVCVVVIDSSLYLSPKNRSALTSFVTICAQDRLRWHLYYWYDSKQRCFCMTQLSCVFSHLFFIWSKRNVPEWTNVVHSVSREYSAIGRDCPCTDLSVHLVVHKYPYLGFTASSWVLCGIICRYCHWWRG